MGMYKRRRIFSLADFTADVIDCAIEIFFECIF